jgi:hypothetical protein
VKYGSRSALIRDFDIARNDLRIPVEDVIWSLTRDIDSQTEFRFAVNVLFRRDCKRPDDLAMFEKALQRFYTSKSEAQGYEYIITLNELQSKIINEKY